MYHYFISYIIKFKDNSIGYGNTEITQGYPIDKIEDIIKIQKVLLENNSGKEVIVLNYQLLYKEEI